MVLCYKHVPIPTSFIAAVPIRTIFPGRGRLTTPPAGRPRNPASQLTPGGLQENHRPGGPWRKPSHGEGRTGWFTYRGGRGPLDYARDLGNYIADTPCGLCPGFVKPK